MQDVNIFLEVYADLRFPFISVDLDKLRKAILQREQAGNRSHFGVDLNGPSPRRNELISSLRGLLGKIDMPPQMINLIASFEAIKGAGMSADIRSLAMRRGAFAIYEHGNRLIWEEESPWPFAFSTLLQQLVNVMALHRALIESRINETEKTLNEHGWAIENVAGTVSEFPRQLPTHLHYAMASLGAWLGGAMNVQYFGYYATIRQIYHADLNIKYAKAIGFSDSDAQALTSSGMVAMPASLIAPLLEAQGNGMVFGSIQIDEFNLANRPSQSFKETKEMDDSRALPGFILDRFYRAPFRARVPDSYGFYGVRDVLRDHYDEFYSGLTSYALVRCKHYCVPVIDVASSEEVSCYIGRIPSRDEKGLFFRGQRRLYPLNRHEAVRRMLFAGSCSKEPSLVTAASREIGYDYDSVHFGLKAFLEEDILRRTDAGESDLLEKWRSASVAPHCRLDSAVLALAQHYGIPSHGLDVTTSEDVALWFATNLYHRDDAGVAKYTTLTPERWPADREEWPVIIVCQTVTQSIEQSLHDCHELASFGFDARRPGVQSARFFQGGHSDHQNRLAEAVVCIFRLAPGTYATQSTFESLFPSPADDPAYRLMLRFASSPIFGSTCGRFVNRFQ